MVFGMGYGQTWRHGDNEVKTTLKRTLQVEQSPRTLPTPETIVVDGCVILWTMEWPKYGTVQYYVNNVLEYIFGKLRTVM